MTTTQTTTDGLDPRETAMPADYWRPCELHGVGRCPICYKLPGDCGFGSCCEPATTPVRRDAGAIEHQCVRHANLSTVMGLGVIEVDRSTRIGRRFRPSELLVGDRLAIGLGASLPVSRVQPIEPGWFRVTLDDNGAPHACDFRDDAMDFEVVS